jgi:hypothetical protein
MGKSSEEIKKMAKKETAKSPISPIWLGMRRATSTPSPLPLQNAPALWAIRARRANRAWVSHRSPRLRRLWRYNIRGPLAHLFRRPIIARNDIPTH